MPNLKFVEHDSRVVYNWLLDKIRDYTGSIPREGDERRIFGEQLAAVVALIYNDLNDAACAKMLRYAQGEVLDALGERLNVVRLNSQPSTTRLQFELSAVQSQSVYIPKGTRATPDGRIFFATTSPITIRPGVLSGLADAESAADGLSYNGFDVGAINVLVDPIPYVKSVVNIDPTEGGDDVESDDHFRERIWEATGKLTTAGPEESYTYWAKSADADIMAVSVVSPNPGEITISALMSGGRLPTQAVLDKIMESCNARDRRPLGDKVTARAPTPIPYGLRFAYYVTPARENEVVQAVEGVGGVIDQFIDWQCANMGRDVNPDKLTQMLVDAGAIRAEIIEPVFAVVDKESVAQFNGTRNTYHVLGEW